MFADRLHRIFAPSIYFYRNPFKICEFNVILRHTALSRNHAVLDVGCGVGKQTFCLAARAGSAVGVDPDPGVLERAEVDRRRYHDTLPVRFICATLKDAGIGNSTFDRVVSFSVIEHISDWPAVAAECFRVLKPGGRFIFSTDTLDTIADAAIRERHRVAHSVCRYGSIDVLRNELEAVGFLVRHAEFFCRTKLAARWFERDILSGGACSWLRTLGRYVLLQCAERCSPSSAKGLFLVIDAEKPAREAE